jgi:hypothetical protein
MLMSDPNLIYNTKDPVSDKSYVLQVMQVYFIDIQHVQIQNINPLCGNLNGILQLVE